MDKVVGSLQTYEVLLPSWKKFKGIVLNVPLNEKKNLNSCFDNMDEVALLSKRVKNIMRF